ncbi:MAG: phytanoyl-CoA dioxygenase family protein, partial [Actinobacteria bacterium]|nr:phytanoyl-CoA dioxygenase family protein [Actinomycetota bacterium]
ADAVAGLRDAYERHGPAPGDVGEYCHFDFQSRDREHKKATDGEIRRPLAEPLARSFVRYRPYYGNYVMKWPSPTSWFGVHQDSCFVDETEAVSASIWVATCEVDEGNGAVWFFPGSHLMRSTIRGSNQMAYSFQDVGASIEARCGRIVRLAPGDAIVFDHRVVHWSFANASDAPRLAAVLGVIPEEAQLIHHHASDDGATVETFAIDDDFFIQNDPFGSLLTGLQGYPSLGEQPLRVVPVTEDELDRWLEAHPVDADVELAATLRRAAEEAAEVPAEAATETGGRGAPGPSPSARTARAVDAAAPAEEPTAGAVATVEAEPDADDVVAGEAEAELEAPTAPPTAAPPASPGLLARVRRAVRRRLR